jgi:hypothetical protein
MTAVQAFWLRVFWKKRFQSDCVLLLAGCHRQRALAGEHRCFSRFSRHKLAAIHKEIRRLTARVERARASSSDEAQETIAAFSSSLGSFADRVRAVINKDHGWHEQARSAREQARDLWRGSADIPGEPFQRQVNRLNSAVNALITGAAQRSLMRETDNMLFEAQRKLAELRRLVETARLMHAAVPDLHEEVARLNSEIVSAGVAARQVYDTLRLTSEAMRRDLAVGHYESARQRYEIAAAMKQNLMADLNRRVRMASDEIELWNDCPPIVHRFALGRFKLKVGMDDLPQWLETREQIGTFVAEQARNVQGRDAVAMKQYDSRLGCSWDSTPQMKIDEALLNFSHAVAEHCGRD